ncbi:MAG: amidohydrolase [Acidimicrobiaceae bacterium]|nr:amidohydrolase [Acidimicrobiaceae bacterium]
MANEELKGDHHYVVISSDNHAGADIQGYKPYLEKKWHDEFDAWAASYTNPWDFVETRVTKDGFSLDTEQILTGVSSWHSSLNWDSAQRKSHLDSDGVVGEIIFPNTAPPFMAKTVLSGVGPVSSAEYERQFAGLQAHNRWLADFCADAPGQRAGIGQVLLVDVDDAIAEVRKIKELGLTGGVLLPIDGPLGGTTPLYVDALEPFWQVCADLDVPMHKHSSAPPEQPGAALDGPGVVAIGFAERQFYNHRAVAQMIFSGVFERHPSLKLIFSESGVGWVPRHLAMLDSIYTAGNDPNGLLHFLAPSMTTISMKPSEYFARNIFLGASLFLPSEAKQRHEIGVDRIMWGVDYPHSEGTFPYSREAIALTFSDCEPEEVALMLGVTAAKVFNFDLDHLQKLADKVGPTVDEVRLFPASIPSVPDQTLSPVFSTGAFASDR